MIREAFYGVRRFDGFIATLGIGRNVLSERLGRLVEAEMLRKIPYQERPVRYEYRLTEKGREFFAVIAAMMRWGDDWLATDGPPVELHSRQTHEKIRPIVVDEYTGEPIDARKIYALPGPGMPEDIRIEAQRRGRFVRPDDGASDEVMANAAPHRPEGLIDGPIDDPTAS